jgi:HemY protein
MRWLFWMLLILGLAVGLALLTGNNQGYVLVVRPPYRLELSLNFLLILVIGSFVFLHLLLRLINYTRHLPATVMAYKENKRLREGQAAFTAGLHAFAQGRYLIAVKSASQAIDLGTNVSLSALIAARASHKLRQKSQREYYLAEAERLAPDDDLARLLTQVELLLDDRQYSEALKTLQRLEKIEPKHPPAMRLALKIHVHLGNWDSVVNLLQQIEKRDALESWQIREVRQQAHQFLIKRYSGDLASLLAYWKKLPEEDRLNNRLAYLAASTLLESNAPDQAAEVIGMSLTKGWDTKLAALVGDCITSQPMKQLEQAEFWLLKHEGDANLLLSLGKMCVRLSLWGKAQSYCEASISVTPTAAAHIALAKLLESRGESEAAYRHYRLSTQLFKDLN